MYIILIDCNFNTYVYKNKNKFDHICVCVHMRAHVCMCSRVCVITNHIAMYSYVLNIAKCIS